MYELENDHVHGLFSLPWDIDNGQINSGDAQLEPPQVNDSLVYENVMTEEKVTRPASQKHKKQQRLSVTAKKDMDSWLLAHVCNPYPTAEEKRMFIMRHGISKETVETYMTNQRIRLLKRGRRAPPTFYPLVFVDGRAYISLPRC